MTSTVNNSGSNTASRFALLQLESDTDLVPGKGRIGHGANKCQASGAGAAVSEEKKEKEKKEGTRTENLAFKKTPQKSSYAGCLSQHGETQHTATQKDCPEENWQEWRHRNEQVCEIVEKTSPQSKAVNKKKNQQGNPKPLTVPLKAFQPDGNIDDIVKKHEEQNSSPSSLRDGGFFNRLEGDVHRIVGREKRKEQCPGYSGRDNCTSGERNQEWNLRDGKVERQKLELEKKDEETEQLKNETTQWEAKCKEVKARNAKLLKMMQEGEMKDKAEILLQVGESQIIKSELTCEVTRLNTALEQERSKANLLQAKLTKYQRGKNGEPTQNLNSAVTDDCKRGEHRSGNTFLVDCVNTVGSTMMESGMEEIAVKVAVRIRPLLSREILHNHQVCVRVIPNTQQIIIGKDRVFTFDFVFGKNSTQEEVYTACIKPLLASLTEGYNATVFTYGQTGSGKTYTIGSGHVVAENEKGIIPRAIQELFQHIAENRNSDFDVQVSYIEVYKEDLRDLLELDTSVKELHIREDEKGNTVIVGAKEFRVECADEAISLLESGNAARHTGTTLMNEHSSRSHAIFTIRICQKRSAESQKNTDATQDSSGKSVETIASKFHFVDLAGSERVTKTGNTGERFKESIQINSGLLALGNVISALGDPKRRSVHIPYRNAKITRILKDSLGGSAKTVMITCVSPSSSDFDESLNSLKYANRAKNIRNKPVINYNPAQDRIDEMELEIRLLREALQNQQVSSQSSHDLNQERTHISALEEQLTRLQAQCFSYRNFVDEAFPFLVDLNNDIILKKSQRDRLQSLISMVQEIQKESLTLQETGTGTWTSQEPHHITILQLKGELKKCQQALVMDEELFNQKDHELHILQNQIKTLLQKNEEQLQSLTETQEARRLQNEKMVEQQMLIHQLKEKLEKFTDVETFDVSSAYRDEPAAVAFARRPYSVPLTKSLLHSLHPPSGTETRKVYTSPPAFSLARVMAEFHARSQMMLSNIEDQDKILHCHLSDKSDEEEENTDNRKKTSFMHSVNQTWTQNQASLCCLPDLSDMNGPVDKSGLSNKSAVQTDTTTGEEIDSLRKSHVFNMQKLKNAELRFTKAKQKMREHALSIKMKEELIKELVRTGKGAQSVSRQYSLKITKLEQECEQAKVELAETQKQLQELEGKELRDIPEKAKLQKEFRKKMDAAKLKVQALQKKRQDTKNLASLANQSKRQATELEQNVAQMKHQQTQLQQRLCEESEKKKQLEAEVQQDQQQIKELQLKMEQQQKILKLKDEEIAAFKNKIDNSVGTSQKLQKLEEQKKWLDEEMERILQQHQELAELEEDLKKREAIVAKKEALLREKSQLEIKKLRSSQALNKDSVELSTRLSLLDQELCGKSVELQGNTTADKTDILEKIQVLQMERDQLLRRRNSIDEKLKDSKVLSAEEEYILFQLEEGIETLEAAIDFKNESIQNRQHLLRSSAQILSQSENNVIGKLVSLSAPELRAILFRYFNKIVGLRESVRKLQLLIEEEEMKVIDKENIIREQESALEHVKLHCDRQLTLQQKEHEKKLQLILHHFEEQDSEGIAETVKGYEVKVQQLEKDLFFYKKTSRELKKKLKGLLGESSNQLLASVNYSSAGDKASSQDEAEVASAEFKLTVQPETSSRQGKIKEMVRTSTSRAQQKSYKLGEDDSEFGCKKECLSSTSDDKARTGKAQPSTSHPELHRVIQRRETVTHFPGVTPVKLPRGELRYIPPSELSLRCASLGAGVSIIGSESLQRDKNSSVPKT